MVKTGRDHRPASNTNCGAFELVDSKTPIKMVPPHSQFEELTYNSLFTLKVVMAEEAPEALVGILGIAANIIEIFSFATSKFSPPASPAAVVCSIRKDTPCTLTL
jgi:hypothetical protein